MDLRSSGNITWAIFTTSSRLNNSFDDNQERFRGIESGARELISLLIQAGGHYNILQGYVTDHPGIVLARSTRLDNTATVLKSRGGKLAPKVMEAQIKLAWQGFQESFESNFKGYTEFNLTTIALIAVKLNDDQVQPTRNQMRLISKQMLRVAYP